VKFICIGCDFETDVVYDAACHSYALGAEHGTRGNPLYSNVRASKRSALGSAESPAQSGEGEA
jgi:hypothetical protein